MIWDFIINVLSEIFGNPREATVSVMLLGTVFYYRRVLAVGGLVRSAVTMGVTTFVVIGALMLLGVIPAVNFGLLLEYTTWTVYSAIEFVQWLIEQLPGDSPLTIAARVS